MPRHKVAELEGFELDSAVDRAVGLPGTDWKGYADDWAVGGPIIERERIGVSLHVHRQELEPPPDSEDWVGIAEVGTHLIFGGATVYAIGPTPLIAAMRAFVASKLGPEVEL